MIQQFEPLNSRLKICVSREHKFGTDAFLLSDFARVRRRDILCDLGTGCGIVLLLRYRTQEDTPREAWGVDIQPQAIRQLQAAVEENHLEGQIHPVCADLRQLKGKVPFGYFDVVTCNPPYQAAQTGILCEEDAHTIARHELFCTLEDVCQSASKLLRFGGRLCLCQRPQRLFDAMAAMRKFHIEPKRLRMVQQRAASAPWLFLLEGRLGSRPHLEVEAPLLMEAPDGQGFSQEVLRIYHKDRALPIKEKEAAQE